MKSFIKSLLIFSTCLLLALPVVLISLRKNQELPQQPTLSNPVVVDNQNFDEYLVEPLSELEVQPEESSSENFLFKLLSNDTYEVAELTEKGKQLSVVVVPKTYLGKQVSKIGDSAFINNFNIEKIYLNNVSEIGTRSFYGASKLSYVSIPKINKIGNSAFENVSLLKTITLLGTTNIGTNAFRNCSNIDYITMVNIDEVDMQKFTDAKNIKRIHISNANIIKNNAFMNMTSLKGVYLYNVNTIGISAFQGSGVTVAYLNNVNTIQSYAFKNTNLNYVFNLSAKIIGDYAFENCIYLKQINLSSVEDIGNKAFNNCFSLTYLNLTSVSSIGNLAFAGCEKISEIDFNMERTINFENEVFQGINNPSTPSNNPLFLNIHGQNWNSANIEKINANITTFVVPIFDYIHRELSLVNVEDAYVFLQKDWYEYKLKDRSYEITGFSQKALNLFPTLDTNLMYLLVLPSSHNGIPVTSVGDYALANVNFEFGGVFLGKVTKIGASAFENFKIRNGQITQLNLNKMDFIGKKAFSNSSFQTVEFHSEQTKIDDFAFENTINLQTVSFSSNMKKIGVGAFSYSGITNFEFENIETIESYAFHQSKIKSANLSNVKQISSNAFSDCFNLETVSWSNNISNIENSTFENNRQLKSIVNMSAVRLIKARAFANCYALNEIDLKNINDINSQAFYNCTSLLSVDLSGLGKHGESLASANEVFNYSSSLKSVYFDSNSQIFNNVSNNFFANTDISEIYIKGSNNNTNLFNFIKNSFNAYSNKSIIVDSEYISFYRDIFGDGYNIQDNYVESSVDLFNFEYRENVDDYIIVSHNIYGTNQKISIPTKYEGKPVNSIGPRAFEGADISVLKMKNIQSIGDFAFKDCVNLTDVNINGKYGMQINSTVFEGANNIININFSGDFTIGEKAFSDKDMLRNVVLNVFEIRSHAFSDSDYIEYLNIKASNVREKAFADIAGTQKLEVVFEVYNAEPSIFERSNAEMYFSLISNRISSKMFKNTNLTRLDILTFDELNIESYAFDNCKKFNIITFKNDLYSKINIDNGNGNVFSGLDNLKNIILNFTLPSDSNYSILNYFINLPSQNYNEINVYSMNENILGEYHLSDKFKMLPSTEYWFDYKINSDSIGYEITKLNKLGKDILYNTYLDIMLMPESHQSQPVVSIIEREIFANTNFLKIDFANIHTLGDYALYQTGNLTELDLSNIKNIGVYGIDSRFGYSLRKIILPSDISNYNEIWLGSATQIETVIIRGVDNYQSVANSLTNGKTEIRSDIKIYTHPSTMQDMKELFTNGVFGYRFTVVEDYFLNFSYVNSAVSPNSIFNTARIISIPKTYQGNEVTLYNSNEGFIGFSEVEKIDLGNLEDLPHFGQNNILNYIKGEKIKHLFSSALYDKPSLETVILPNVERIEDLALFNCINLKTAQFDNLLYIGNSALAECTKLTEIYAPLLQEVSNNALTNSGIVTLDISNLRSAQSTFINDSNLRDLIINTESNRQSVDFIKNFLVSNPPTNPITIHVATEYLTEFNEMVNTNNLNFVTIVENN